jgi:hypothetical protein
LSLPTLVMLTWFYLDRRSIKQRDLKRFRLRSQSLEPKLMNLLQTWFPLCLCFPNELQSKIVSHIQVF